MRKPETIYDSSEITQLINGRPTFELGNFYSNTRFLNNSAAYLPVHNINLTHRISLGNFLLYLPYT